jgi:hypothetical protein
MYVFMFLSSCIARIRYYKQLADQSFAQLNDEDFQYRTSDVDNSIAVIIQHMSGNMCSRFTDFLTSDGEKAWRQRDLEFEERGLSRTELMELWEKGWSCFLGALGSLTEADLDREVAIRGEKLRVMDAIIRQMAHYPYHIGQIVHIARQIRGIDWQSLSIPRGGSQSYNNEPGRKDPGLAR